MQLSEADTPAARMSGGGVAFMGTGIRLKAFYRLATADLLFLLLLQKKKRRVRNDHDGTSRRKRRLLSSVLISSFPNRKRFAGLRFGARRDFDFPPDLLEPTKKTASVFLDLSREDWKICIKNFLSGISLASPFGRGGRAKRGRRGYTLNVTAKPSQSPAATALPEGEPRGLCEYVLPGKF